MPQTAFNSLPAAQQLNAVQLYLGPYARGDAISRTLAEAAVNPDIAASIMSRHVAAGSDAGGVAAMDATIDRGDAGVQQPSAGSSHTGASQGQVQSPNADQVSDSNVWPWLAAGAAAGAAATYAATRGRGSNDPNVQTGVDPSTRGEVIPEGTQPPPSANTDQRAIPPQQPLEGEVIPGGRPIVRVDPLTGEIIEGELNDLRPVPVRPDGPARNVPAQTTPLPAPAGKVLRQLF